jgi:cytochrome P450/NADPH-cytochrome P450 reductase
MMDEEFEKLPKGAWKPFGTGMRACIGRPFAWQEALLVMAILLQNFDFRMDDPSYQLKVKSTLTIKPQGFYMRSSLRPGITATSLQHKFAGSADHVKASTNSDPAPVAGSSSGRPMTILYGSNTGTCQSFAQKLASDARTHGFNATVKDLDAGVNGLPTDAPTVIITASYEGLPPDNAAQFVAWLDAIKGEQALKGVKYAVFGCGHKDWSSTFHRIPRLVDTTVGQLGGERLVEIGTTDASQGDMFSGFDNWCEAFLWPAISAKFGSDFSADQPRKGIDMEISTKTRASQLQHDVKQGKVLVAKTLTAPGEPEKRHLEIELPDGMEYDAGDYLVVLPNNPDDSIHRVLSKYSIPFDAVITIKDGGPVTLPAGKSVSALDLLKGYVELSLPATKKVCNATSQIKSAF